MTTAPRFVLSELLARAEELDAALKSVNEEIKREVADSHDPFVRTAIELLQTIPGVGERVAEVVASEIGVDMTRFPMPYDLHILSFNQ